MSGRSRFFDGGGERVVVSKFFRGTAVGFKTSSAPLRVGNITPQLESSRAPPLAPAGEAAVEANSLSTQHQQRAPPPPAAGLPVQEAAQCGICLDPATDAAVLPCNRGHVFCYVCILTWSKIANVCPLCKKVFNSISSGGRHSAVENTTKPPAEVESDEAAVDWVAHNAQSLDGSSYAYNGFVVADEDPIEYLSGADEESEEEASYVFSPERTTTRRNAAADRNRSGADVAGDSDVRHRRRRRLRRPGERRVRPRRRPAADTSVADTSYLGQFAFAPGSV